MKSRAVFSVLLLLGLLLPFTRPPSALAQGPVKNMLYLPAVIAPGYETQPAIDPPPGPIENDDDGRVVMDDGMIDAWVFVDADRNGIYSSGDVGLSGVVVCVDRIRRGASCVGTDEGDTWWEDLRIGEYQVRLDPATLPAGSVLRSIRCEETGSRDEYRDCRYRLESLSSSVILGESTRLNIFFALEP